MWYTGVSGLGGATQIGYATSSDRVTWTKYEGNPVVGTGTGWEGERVYRPSVLKVSDTYKMWYSGKSTGLDYAIGYATSSDGIEEA